MTLNLSPLDILVLALSAQHAPAPDPAQLTGTTPWYQYHRPTPGALMRAMLRELNLSQRDLAIRLGIHFVTLNRIVQGRQGRSRITLKTRMKIEQLCTGHSTLDGIYRMVEWPNL